MDQREKIESQYVQVLREELLPAMGCTEPIAIAYAAAKARAVLGVLPERLLVEVSGNIIKNVKSVVVPHTGGLRGIPAAAAAGAVAGDAEAELEVLSRVTGEQIARMADYVRSVPIEVRFADTPHIFDIQITAFAGADSACVRIVDYHTNLVLVRRNVLLNGGDPARAEELLRALGLETLARQRAWKLSGGETAKMALCRILMGRYGLLILDEPTAALDMESTLAAEELIRRLKRAQFAKQKIATFKPTIDKRYSDLDVVSHDSHSISCTPIKTPSRMLQIDPDIEVVGIDEAQFFDDSIIGVVQELAGRGVRVIIAGLDTDFLGKPFGPMPGLMAIAEDVQKVHAICVRCGSLANHSHRLSASKKLVVLGEKDTYEPLCRDCYNKAVQEDKEG